MTRACGVIGKPLRHSISATFQQAAFDAVGLDVRYHAWELEPSQLARHLAWLRTPDALGCNVTIPYKTSVLDLIDEADVLVRRVGAANTMVNDGGRLLGFNTDVGGFLRAVRDDGGCDPAGIEALLLGAGGAARAAAVALLDAGVARLQLANRHLDRARELAEHLGDGRVTIVEWHGEAFRSAVAGSALIVNATSAGMLGRQVDENPLVGFSPPASGLVFDLVANPLRTRLMQESSAAGARTLGGLPMLVYQGAESFERWTGLPAPVDVMMRAAEAHMRHG